MIYKVHPLDVWGNEEDGFDVNDVYGSIGTVEIPDDATDAEIVKILKEDGFLQPSVKKSDVQIDGEAGYTLYIEDARNGRPEYHLIPKD